MEGGGALQNHTLPHPRPPNPRRAGLRFMDACSNGIQTLPFAAVEEALTALPYLFINFNSARAASPSPLGFVFGQKKWPKTVKRNAKVTKSSKKKNSKKVPKVGQGAEKEGKSCQKQSKAAIGDHRSPPSTRAATHGA